MKCHKCGSVVYIVVTGVVARQYDPEDGESIETPTFETPVITTSYAPSSVHAKCKCRECPYIVVERDARRRTTYRLVLARDGLNAQAAGETMQAEVDDVGREER